MEVKRVFDLIYYQKQKFPLENALNSKVNGEWKGYSTQEVIDIVNELSLGFLEFGIAKNDKVAIVSDNRPEWNFIDLALQQIGAVSVPLYPTISADDYAYIMDHAEVKLAFAADEELLNKLKEACEKIGERPLFTFDPVSGVEDWNKFRATVPEKLNELEEIKQSVGEEDLLTLIYTSGTTGKPKGVMLTHKNILSNAIAVGDRLDMEKGKWRAVSFLPLSHIYERTGIYFYVYNGASVYYAESIEAIGDNIREVKPQIFNCVPRLLEKIYDKIVAKGEDLTGVKRNLFFWALNLGLKYEPHKSMGFSYNLKLGIARKLIFSKWLEALGGEIKAISSGGAALQSRLGRVFWAAGIPITEGYGLTETSPVITASSAVPEKMRVGCVGYPIDGVEIKIADDGEILCKGPNVMKGYYKESEKTDEVMSGEWFHTGDIGEILEGEYLKITDRKKEMFKTSGGKYIAPQVMENRFKESGFIENIAVLGDGKRFPSALIVPNFEVLRKWCSDNGIADASDEELVKDQKVIDKMDKIVAEINSGFGHWEQIKKIRLITQPFTIETGEMTPKLSLKRRVINEKYTDLIEDIYA
ncbi:MAG: long-chain fatty acid--CoA ligase [Bacteroidota bacterium]